MKVAKVLFVCMGNICRSPAAEGVMKHLVESKGLQDQIQVDSAGTNGYHVGEMADPRMRKAAEERGYQLLSRARQFTLRDFQDFDFLIAMDQTNRHHMLLHDTSGNFQDSVYLFSDFCRSKGFPKDVPDPYYGGDDGFEYVLDMIEAGCPELLELIVKKRL